MDKYTSGERLNRLVKGKKLDRVPFSSSATMFAGKVLGLTAEEYYYDPCKSFDAQKKVRQMVGCDFSPGFDVPNGEILDYGGDITIDLQGEVGLSKPVYAIRTLNDAIDFEVPDISKRRHFQDKMKFIRYANENGCDGANISIGSPFSVLGTMLETSQLLRWLKNEPSLVHDLIKKVVKSLLEQADATIAEFGVENCSVSGNCPYESNDLISPKMFEEFALPYTIQMYNEMKRRGIKSLSIHLCGNQKHNLPLYKEIHLPEGSGISLDEKNSFAKVTDVLGHNHVYYGNVPSGLLVYGKPEDVYKISGEIIETMKYNEGGFVLAPSCDLPINAKMENINAMLKACRDYGKY